MANIWKNLGKSRLQELIGKEQLSRLEKLLPGLRKGNFDMNEMYSSDGLTKIFDAFFGYQKLLDSNFRRELFNTLPPEKIDAALRALGIDSSKIGDFGKKAEQLPRRAWETREAAKNVGHVLEIPEDALPEDKKSFVLIQDLMVAERPYKPLKEYQMPVFTKAMEKLEPELARFIIQMPTGSGKTRTAIEIITDYFKTYAEPGDIVLWLAHSEELCEQAMASFLDIWPHVATKPLKAIRFWGSEAKSLPHDFRESAFIVAGFPKLYSKVKANDVALEEIKKRVSLIVVDEAHKVLAETYKAVTESFIHNRARVIGLTATPGRSAHDQEENAALAQFFFNNMVQIETASRETVLDYLRKKRVLSQTNYEPLVTKLDYKLSEKDKSHLEQFFDLPKDFLSKLGNDDIRNTEIVKKLEHEATNGKRIIFFACSLEQSQFVSALLRFMNVKAAHVDGTTPKAQRAGIIQQFKSGQLSVLCNYEVLSTGFDAPQTDVVFIARPTSSIVLYSQMIGRGLRGPAIGGTETCKVIDVIDNIQGFSDENKVYSYFENYYSNQV